MELGWFKTGEWGFNDREGGVGPVSSWGRDLEGSSQEGVWVHLRLLGVWWDWQVTSSTIIHPLSHSPCTSTHSSQTHVRMKTHLVDLLINISCSIRRLTEGCYALFDVD
jgi:hypothetical protein